MKKIYMGIPTTGSIVDVQPHTLRIIEEKYKDEVKLVYPKKSVRRIFHDFARNAIVDEFLESDCDVLWFLDSDIAPQYHVLDLVTKHWDKWLAAGAPYPVFMTPAGDAECQIVFCVYKGNNEQGLSPSDIPYEGIEFVDGLATGCMFLKREIFSKLEKPYFEFKYDNESRKMIEGEDIGFCLKLKKQGIQFLTDYSMVCKHYKNVCLLELNNYAVSFANKSVARYDGLVRGKVEALATMLNSRKMSDTPSSKSSLILP